MVKHWTREELESYADLPGAGPRSMRRYLRGEGRKRRMLLGPTRLTNRIRMGRLHSRSYPQGIDYAYHPIGTQIGNDRGISVRKKNSDGRYVVPHFAVSKMQNVTRLGAGKRFGTGTVTVQTDFRDGTQAMHRLNEGWQFNQVCEVYGLTTQSPTSVEDLRNDAEAGVVAIFGNRGSPGPMMSSGVSGVMVNTIIDSFEFDLESPDFCIVKINYKGYPLPTMSIDGAQGHIESNLDVNGNPIYVSYTYKNDYGTNPTPSSNSPVGNDPTLSGTTDVVSKLIDKPVFEATVTIAFMIVPPCILGGRTVNSAAIASYLAAQANEVNINLYDPTGVSTLYPGSGYLLGAPYCWLLETPHFDTHDGQVTFWGKLTFHLRAVTWNTTVTYVCRDTGEPPADLVPGTGQKTVQEYAGVVMPSFVFAPN